MSNYFGIGVFNPKHEVNIGTLWRHAMLFEATFIFTIGKRYNHQYSDTEENMMDLKAIKARLAAYEDATDYNLMDYPARGKFLRARQEIKMHATDDIPALVERVEELEQERLMSNQKALSDRVHSLDECKNRLESWSRTHTIIAFQIVPIPEHVSTYEHWAVFAIVKINAKEA